MLIGVVTAALVLIAVYSWFQLAAAKAEATQARQTLADCETLIRSIQELDKKPTRVLTQSNSQDTIGELVTDAVELAGLRIGREGVRQSVKAAETERIGRSDYQIVKNRVIIDGVTLRQVLEIVQRLESRRLSGEPVDSQQAAGIAGLQVRDLTLTVNDASRAGNELWNAEAVLTQTVYSPTKR